MAAEGAVDVEIFGRRYRLRSSQPGEDLGRIAAYVDRRMRELAQYLPQQDTVKLAVLAALNIAEELFRERQTDPGTRTERIRERVEGLIAKVDAALGASP